MCKTKNFSTRSEVFSHGNSRENSNSSDIGQKNQKQKYRVNNHYSKNKDLPPLKRYAVPKPVKDEQWTTYINNLNSKTPVSISKASNNSFYFKHDQKVLRGRNH